MTSLDFTLALTLMKSKHVKFCRVICIFFGCILLPKNSCTWHGFGTFVVVHLGFHYLLWFLCSHVTHNSFKIETLDDIFKNQILKSFAAYVRRAKLWERDSKIFAKSAKNVWTFFSSNTNVLFKETNFCSTREWHKF